jgi:hypothetical protein
MFRTTIVALSLLVVSLHAQTPGSAPVAAPDLAPLFSNIWRTTGATPYPNSGSIYIFLRNGTLLETSCVETYRIATWKPDPKKPATIEVAEDARPAFSAALAGFTDRTLHLRQTLAFGDHQVRDLTFTAIDKEFVCPDTPK